MNVHQLSISYVPEQDRILIRVSTLQGQELRFWFTRRLTLGLLPLLERAALERAARQGGPASAHVAGMDAIAQKAVSDFQRSETLKGSDFSTPYKSPESAPPRFESPLLVTEVNLAPLSNGQLRLSLAEKLSGVADHRSLQMGLTDALTHAFVHLLERALTQSEWRGPQPAASTAPADGPVAAPDRPPYLN